MRCFVHFDFKMCFSPKRRAFFRHQNFKKCSNHEVFCTFWLQNVLLAKAACIFSTSELQKVLRTWGVLYTLTSKCASDLTTLFGFSTVHIVGSLLFKLPSMRWVRMVLVTPTYLGKKTFNSELQTTNSRNCWEKNPVISKSVYLAKFYYFTNPDFPERRGSISLTFHHHLGAQKLVFEVAS